MVENGGFGAQSAAPIVRQVFDYYLNGHVPGGPAPETDASDDDNDGPLIGGEPHEAE
jgi:penicillin-binding protein 2